MAWGHGAACPDEFVRHKARTASRPRSRGRRVRARGRGAPEHSGSVLFVRELPPGALRSGLHRTYLELDPYRHRRHHGRCSARFPPSRGRIREMDEGRRIVGLKTSRSTSRSSRAFPATRSAGVLIIEARRRWGACALGRRVIRIRRSVLHVSGHVKFGVRDTGYQLASGRRPRFAGRGCKIACGRGWRGGDRGDWRRGSRP